MTLSAINALYKEFVSHILENGLETELDDDLGYSKYDYRDKETDNSPQWSQSKNLES